MPEQRNQGWWHTVPGLLTAAAAFVGALSGLLAGLNQMGLFDRSPDVVQSPQTTASISPAEHDTSAPRPRAILPPEQTSGPEPARTPAPRPPVKSEIRPGAAPSLEGTNPSAATAPLPATSVPADAASPTPDTTPVADTAAVADSAPSPPAPAAPVEPAPDVPTAVLPSGTVLELAAGTRICSTTSADGDRFNASLVVPIATENGVVLPVGTIAVLEVRRARAPTFLNVRLDSIVRGGTAVRIRKAETRFRRELVAGAEDNGAAVGACIPAGGRITATLRAPFRLGAR
ncbi:MAG: hypothetical protein H0V43_10645 [Gemmatimonadales bacterium]|nr:hypothetical protein [Gemmatimonadales bacterium]